MKVAIIQIPYPAHLVLPLDALAALQHHNLATAVGYGSDRKFTITDPANRIEMLIVDDSEIEPFQPQSTENTPPRAEDDGPPL